MTKGFFGIVLAISLVPAMAAAQEHRPDAHHHGSHGQPQPDAPSPYAAEQDRDIAALSPDEISALLGGSGMGLARPAEFHSYPGPLHVRELGDHFGLTAQQRKATDAIYDRMKEEAVRLGATIVEAERELDRLFASGRIDRESLERHVSRIAELQGRLRATHLRAHLEMKEILTPDQVGAYDRLRGYRESP